MQRCSGKKMSREKGGSHQDAEESSFPRMNWFIVLVLQFIMAIIYSTLIPSMHQFVTNPTEGASAITSSNATAKETETDVFWPGLGLSEYFYSWVVSMYSVGELISAPLSGFATKYIPYRYTILVSSLTLAIGSLLYAVAVQGWVILIARLLLGLNVGSGIVLVTTYLGETATEVTAKKETAGGKQDPSGATLKDKLFIWYTFSNYIGYLAGLVISAIMAQFSQIDPYRWSAWLVLTLGTLYIITFLIVFKENRAIRLPKCYSQRNSETKNEKSRSSHQRSGQGHNCKDYMLYAFLIVCGYIAGALYTVLDTLLAPLLSDHLGFTIGDISYFVLGTTVILVVATAILYILKKFRMDNRKVFMLSLLLPTVGGFIVSDWQSIGSDPCLVMNAQELSTRELPQSNDVDSSMLLTEIQLHPDFTNYTTLQLRKACEALSTPEDQCRWNPVSQFTGKYCQSCRPVCRSMRRSLNFFQVCIGVALVTIAIPIGVAASTVIASDFVSLEMQGTIIGLMFTAAGLARVISPLWVDASYEASGKHTLVPMSIMNGTLALVLVVFAALYKELAPRTHAVSGEKNEQSATIIKSKSASNEHEPKGAKTEVWI